MKNKTIEQLENDIWKIQNDSTRLIQRCHELRKKPLNEFDIEDLRIMVGQNIGLKFLIPICIEKLQANLFAEGDFYEGDLLQSVFNVDEKFWKEHSTLKEKINHLILGRESELEEYKIRTDKFLKNNN